MPKGENYKYIPRSYNIFKMYVPSACLSSVFAYNEMLLDIDFYKVFQQYEYILICHLDVIVTMDLLDDFCEIGYDYWGAPWPYLWGRKKINDKYVHLTVGNGGFSLRRVSACISVLEQFKKQVPQRLNEDIFFSYYLKVSGFRVAPVNWARLFSAESLVERIFCKNGGTLPFGMHAWHRFSGDFYKKVLPKLGINIAEFKLQNLDLVGLRYDLSVVASQRLRRYVTNGKDIWRFLPTNTKYSFHVFGHNGSVYYKYMTRDLNETVKVHYYSDDIGKEFGKLVCNMKNICDFNLLIIDGFDGDVIDSLRRYNLYEGTNYISLQQSYIKYLKCVICNYCK